MPPSSPAARLLVICAVLACAAGAAMARTDAPPLSKNRLYAGQAATAKIASELLRAREMLRRTANRDELEAAAPNLRVADHTIELDVRLWRLTPDLVERIRSLGFTVQRAHYGAARVVLSGSPELLEALAALPEVSVIHPRYAPRLRAGAVDDQADVSIGASAARAAFGVDGSGVSVGIVSDSFHDRIGGQISGAGCTRTLTGSAPQGSGDLPASVAVLDSGPGNGSDEGAAIGELVHDLAPGAALLFRAATMDEADYADGIDALVGCGATVLVDDLIFLTEPMFQDGVVAQAEMRAVAAGVSVFSAAGNEAGFGVLQGFVDADPSADEQADTPTGIDFNDFGGGARFAGVTLPAGCGITAVLQWNEPFSGTLGPGATTDLDLYVYDTASPASPVLASSIDSQGCSTPSHTAGGDPLEIATYVNHGSEARTVYLAVDQFCGTVAPTFRLVTFPVDCGFPGTYGFDQTIFHSAQIYGHCAADGVIAVAAVDYRELDTGGSVTGIAGRIDTELFSSLGGDLPFFLDPAGRAIPDGPVFRFKPELAAPDGVNTTFFGGDRPGDTDTAPNFFGTSAAAPHAAAVAALLRQANPALGPSDIRSVLLTTAGDIGVAGADDLSGDGVVDAPRALEAALTRSPAATPTGTASATVASPTATAAASATVPPTATAAPSATSAGLAGDCDGDHQVSVSDLIRGVRIALGEGALSDCPSFDRNGDLQVSIAELLQAVDSALAEAPA